MSERKLIGRRARNGLNRSMFTWRLGAQSGWRRSLVVTESSDREALLEWTGNRQRHSVVHESGSSSLCWWSILLKSMCKHKPSSPFFCLQLTTTIEWLNSSPSLLSLKLVNECVCESKAVLHWLGDNHFEKSKKYERDDKVSKLKK